MKKRKILIIVLIILTLLGYFGYKGYNYILYKPDNISNKNYTEFMNSFKIHEDMIINKKELKDNDYLTFKNIKIRNDFKEYQLQHSSDNEQVYCKLDENGNTVSVFRIGISETNIYEILNIDALINKIDKEQFLKENHIETDLDLLNYVLKKHNVNNNIFTSVKNMKYNYMTQYYTYTTLSNPAYVTKITGDYEGYLLGGENSQKWKNINTVNILKDDKVYKFSFWIDNKFTEEYIKDIIETITIENYINESETTDNISEYDTFIRTYNILNITESNDYDYIYLTIKQFQGEEVETVKVKRSLNENIKEDNNYEFTFRKNNSNNLEDNIKSIFENTELITITKTDKIGLEQVQEPIK